jgi:hypothetical protein
MPEQENYPLMEELRKSFTQLDKTLAVLMESQK